ncbi:hypothetical protein A9Q99_19105 [Gammaproteobacteria bacterium 45_16_T64]|nr:hypothetical protein A9Q99_19105 [Gammaproteobacteria bacterium 45_16_T64]
MIKYHYMLMTALAVMLVGCGGEAIPESKQLGSPRDWNNDDVDAVVSTTLEKIYSPLSGIAAAAPDVCDNIQFLRMKHRDATDDASDADAVFLMMPGILEGANAFEYIGRQMVYIAEQQYGEHIEVWGIDRRANCLEDLYAFNYVEQFVVTPEEAEEVLLGYYFKGQPHNNKTFEGFLTSEQLPYLEEFGMALATEDMFTIMETMMPDQTDRQAKLFVGGHSLGGIHTSVFLAWDKDGDPTTTEDAGYANTAGAFALDSILTPLNDIPNYIASLIPFHLGKLGLPIVNLGTKAAYHGAVKGIASNKVPRTTTFENGFSSRVLALPEAIAALAVTGPDLPSVALQNFPQEPDVNFIMDMMNTRNFDDLLHGPDLREYRYTQESMVALFFDDNFSTLGFLGTSLGHLNGGPMAEKAPLLSFLNDLPLLGNFVDAIYTSRQQHIGTNTDTLYSWANFDEVASPSDPTYTDVSGRYVFTDHSTEMSDIKDFTRALYVGETNLTEWYFPTRIMIDSFFGIPFPHATDVGLKVYHRNATLAVPKIEFIGGEGAVKPLLDLGLISDVGAQRVILEGMNHLDPMFAVANASSHYHNPVINTLLQFAREHRTQ